MDIREQALSVHTKWLGKLEIGIRCPMETGEDLTLAYTPGVAFPCLEIKKDVSLSYIYTRRHNMVAVITDGTAVLGLGDIGPEAGMPVMEGKCALFKTFAGVDAFPICLRTKDIDEIVRTIEIISGSFGGINLEDISAPRCFEIERRLKEVCDIPIFHDDQHGTAVVVLAALTNAARLSGRVSDMVIVINGAGASAIANVRLLLRAGVKDIIICDRQGVVYEGRPKLDGEKAVIAPMTNKSGKRGLLGDALEGADVFIGLSVEGALSQDMVRRMSANPIVFAMANPTPEIMPDEAKAAGAKIVGTGRSDFANQINNVLAFPGIFRGALDVRASDINDEMKIAAARAIAGIIGDSELSPDYIIPSPFDPRIALEVAKAVSDAAISSGVARMAD